MNESFHHDQPAESVRPDPECPNCDGRGCMSCVLRHWHDECIDDCPFCCPSATTEVLKIIGYRHPNVALILHSEAQHEKWGCEGCKPVFEVRHNDGDEHGAMTRTVYACDPCGWEWPHPGQPPEDAECPECGGPIERVHPIYVATMDVVEDTVRVLHNDGEADAR